MSYDSPGNRSIPRPGLAPARRAALWAETRRRNRLKANTVTARTAALWTMDLFYFIRNYRIAVKLRAPNTMSVVPRVSVFRAGKEDEAGHPRMVDAVQVENKPLECRFILLGALSQMI